VADEERLSRLADSSVRVGANVQPGQLVVVTGFVENAPVMREVARSAYRAGARRVEPQYLDRHFTRALVELGPEESLDYTPPWSLTFYNTLFDENATCHIAYGAGFAFSVEDEKDRAEGLNDSAIHTDFMVGGPNVQADGLERGGNWVPVLRDNEFRIG
jgi:leucyl aminopeptidase (aminopeptidase T)